MPSKKEQLQVPGHPDYLPDLREFVDKIGTAQRLPEKLVNTFKLAVDEAATNIIKHAYRNYQNVITIQADVQKTKVTFILIDQGKYFDPSWAEDPNLSKSAKLGERPPLGIFMLRKLMDKIEYNRTDKGNELKLIKIRKSRKRRLVRLKYSAFSLIVYTSFIGAIFFHLRSGLAEKLSNQYYSSGKRLANVIAEKVKPVKAELLRTNDGLLYIRALLQPIYENNIWQIFNIALIDTTGKIQWSTRSSQIGMPFSRPSSIHISEGLFAYSYDGVEVLEFEQQAHSGGQGSFAGKVQVLLMQEYLQNQISFKKFDYLKEASISLAIGYFLITFFVFFSQSNLKRSIDLSKKFLNRFKFDPTVQPVAVHESSDDNFVRHIDQNKENEFRSFSNEQQPKQKTNKTSIESSSELSQEGFVESEDPRESTADSNGRQAEEQTSVKLNGTPLLLTPADSKPKSEISQVQIKKQEIKPEKPAPPLPLNLMDFLDLLNKERDTLNQYLDVSPVKLNDLKPISQQNRAEDNATEDAPSAESEVAETSAASKPESGSEKESGSLDIEFSDISDSLVDTLFDDYVDKVAPTAQDREKEIHEPILPTGAKNEVEKPKQRSRKRKKAPERREDSILSEVKEPSKVDVPETDIEAKSLLVESITDLLAKVKSIQSHEQPEQAPSEKARQKVQTQPTSIARQSEPEPVEKISQSETETILAKGILSFRKKLYEDAIIAFRKVLKLDSENKNALVMLGNSYYKNNMTKESLSAYETLKKKYPGETIAHENLALIYLAQDLPQLAIREWKSALTLSPHRRDLMEKINQASNSLKTGAGNGGRVRSNEQKANSHGKTDNRNQEALAEERSRLLNKGIAHYRQRDFNRAIQIFESIIHNSPDFQEAYSFLGIIYFRNKMFDKAKAIFERLQQVKTETATVHENLGLIYAQEGSYREAVSELKEVLRLTPKRTDIKEKINQFAQLV